MVSSEDQLDKIADIQDTVLLVFSIVYGVAFVLVAIYGIVKELKEHKTSINTNASGVEDALSQEVNGFDKDKQRCDCSKKRMKSIGKRIWKYRSIYLTILIHFSDVVTDYLIFLEYLVKAQLEYRYGTDTFENVDYIGACIMFLLILIVHKAVSSIYYYRYTNNILFVILHIFDFSIFVEMAESHKHETETDLLLFLQKMERLLESAPQFILQTYILFRNPNAKFTGLTFLSIFLSFYSLSSKIVNDDKKMFIHSSKANKKFPPSKGYITRTLFRFFEICNNLLLFVVILIYGGAFWLFIMFGWLLLTHYFLYHNGLLGTDKFNIVGYCFAVLNLGLTPDQRSLTDRYSIKSDWILIHNVMMRINYGWIQALTADDNIVNTSDYDNSKSICKKIIHGCDYYFAFYLLLNRIVIGCMVCLICLILLIFDVIGLGIPCIASKSNIFCTSIQSRTAHSGELISILIISILFYVGQLLLYCLIIPNMHLGMILSRDIVVKVVNHQFRDAARQLAQQSSDIKCVPNQLMNMLIQHNATILTKDSPLYDEDIGKNNEYLQKLVTRIDGTQQETDKMRQAWFIDAIIKNNLSVIKFLLSNRRDIMCFDIMFLKTNIQNMIYITTKT